MSALPHDAAWRARAAKVIPGGMYGHQATTLLPDGFPQFFARAEGARLWDVDGRMFIDMMCGYGPNLFGYGCQKIDAAFQKQLYAGDCMTGPSAIMVELAEALTAMVTHADWAMFCKNGTDATTMAATVARAHTGKRKLLVARGAYHGAAPWCTPRPAGVLPEDRAHVLSFVYNDVNDLARAFTEAGDDVAGLFAAPFKHDAFQDQADVDPAYARACRAACNATGALLIVDDVRAGFRLARDCSWARVGVQPDLSAWGKAIANGHPISALLGAERARDAAASIYVTGSFWFAAAPMAAALATLRMIRETDYLERLETLGGRLRDGIAAQAARHGVPVRQTGPVQMPQILLGDDPDFRKGFHWARVALDHGLYVHPWHNMFLNAAMTDADIDAALAATDAAFAAVAKNGASLPPVPQLRGLFA
ncbi:MAG: aminotransferase class III-fold pyridoxal phosphate-dependent enzyme [Hyphomonadaceae bacterium]|nr:aminotransferase class III-fold pyridoxal phosphate-dependent enzyme [Hyphomonadaceae bacterium]